MFLQGEAEKYPQSKPIKKPVRLQFVMSVTVEKQQWWGEKKIPFHFLGML